ncbi:MAG: hypothetical protein V4481_02160 [Patescibacteria group bacterium]
MLCAIERVDEAIVSLLREKELKGKELRIRLASQGIQVSSQAVYNALKKLIGEEVVLKKGTLYSLNYVWLKRLNQFSKLPEVRSTLLDLQSMKEGDKDSYEFNNLNRAAIFWMHIHQILLDSLKSKQIAALYSANEWTSIIRKPGDLEWAKTAIKNDKLTLFAIGQKNQHNIDYKVAQSSGNLQISVGNTFDFAPGYYLNIFNDYVVELVMSDSVGRKLNQIFDESGSSDQLMQKVVDRGLHASKIKLIIRKNHNLAQKLFRRISKDFYIAKEFSSPLLK